MTETVGGGTPDRARLREVIAAVASGLVERDAQARCLVLAALAGEHVLFVGPPGTAKSELARRLHQVVGGRYFERLLTRFTVPEELFGPLSLAALDEGRYERDIDGYLPTASIGFLDEVFKANSAILNALLTLLNEREFDQGARRLAVPLVSLVGASNELPDDEALRAFLDRFLFRCAVAPVSDEGFAALLAGGPAPGAGGPVLTLAELSATRARGDRVLVPPVVREALTDLRAHLREHAVEVSDRRWVRLVRALRVAAAAHGRDAVAVQDLPVLEWLVAERAEQAVLVREWVAERLGAGAAEPPQRVTRIVEAFERQIELEQSATELAFDDSGKLALVRSLGGADGEALSSGAPRLSAFSRVRRYSATHLAARIAQIDQVLDEIASFEAVALAHAADTAQGLRENLWVSPPFVERVLGAIDAQVARVRSLRDAMGRVRAQFEALPRTEQDDGQAPPPVDIAA